MLKQDKDKFVIEAEMYLWVIIKTHKKQINQ